MNAVKPLVDDLAGSYLRTFQVPGLALGVMFEQACVVRAGYGTTRLGSSDPVTSRTLFHMASITKPVVATAVMQSVERGKVDLDAPFARYVPQFCIADSRGAAITVKQLLTHTSGLPDVESYGWNAPQYDDGALDRYIQSLASLRLLSAPGARFSYSDIGFNILGALIARVSGMAFEDYLARHLLEPAGMLDSSLLLRKVDASKLASPHMLDQRGTPQVCSVFPYSRPHAGSSTLYSNVEDMLRWMTVNLRHGEIDGHRLLRPDTHAAMLAPVIGSVHPAIPRNGCVGLSWFIFRRDQHEIIGHMGQDDGFASLLLLVPERGIGIISMANRSHDYAQAGLWGLHFNIIDRLLT